MTTARRELELLLLEEGLPAEQVQAVADRVEQRWRERLTGKRSPYSDTRVERSPHSAWRLSA